MLSALVAYLYAGEYLWLVIPHALAHAFYVYFWNTGDLAIRIRDWSAKEYTGQWVTPDFYLTCFDITTHACMIYALMHSSFNLSQVF